jgi:hypothetical protein
VTAAKATPAPILVVGSVALDSIETPFETREDVLGGAAVHFSAAASLFTRVRLVAVVGRDFPLEALDILRQRDVDLEGLEITDGPSFRWRGRYALDMNHRDTLDLQLGVFSTFRPKLPKPYLDSEVVFLANTDPDLQLQVLGQAKAARLTACDTIDHWIAEKRGAIDELFSRVDVGCGDPGTRLPGGADQERRERRPGGVADARRRQGDVRLSRVPPRGGGGPDRRRRRICRRRDGLAGGGTGL